MEVRFTLLLFVLLFACFVLTTNKSYGQFRYSNTSAIELVRFPGTDDSLKNDKKDSSGFKQKLIRINLVGEDVVKYSPLPIISYSTETDWMFGMTKFNGFRLGSKGENDTTIQSSQVTAMAYFMLNHQYKIGTEVNLMFHHNRYKSHSEVYYLNFTQFFLALVTKHDWLMNDWYLQKTSPFRPVLNTISPLACMLDCITILITITRLIMMIHYWLITSLT